MNLLRPQFGSRRTLGVLGMEAGNGQSLSSLDGRLNLIASTCLMSGPSKLAPPVPWDHPRDEESQQHPDHQPAEVTTAEILQEPKIVPVQQRQRITNSDPRLFRSFDMPGLLPTSRT
jgi:hypothetical protein